MLVHKANAVRALGALLLSVTCGSQAAAQEVPLDGFFPLVGIGLTDEFSEEREFQSLVVASDNGVTGNLLGTGGTPNYEIALLDTGAAISLITDSAFDRFGLGEPSAVSGADGYRGGNSIPIGGATGQLFAEVNDPLGLYATGLQDRSIPGDSQTLAMNGANFRGQTNTTTLTFPPTSELPNVLGLPYASRYTTSIRNDQPQVFKIDGRTVRTPSVEFLPLGSGGGDIVRKAPLSLNPGGAFTTPPAYFKNTFNLEVPASEDPFTPTVLGGGLGSGGLFLNVTAQNGEASLGQQEFFFDTGASVTVLSELSALTLGFDSRLDTPDFTLSIIGSGGEISDVPGFYLDRITLPALGGSIIAENVPVVVLDVTDASDQGNIVPGIVGTNLLAGRNVVIDPNPSIGAGGESAGVYISDPVTSDFVWDTASALAAWSSPSSWDAAATPDLLSVAQVRHVAGGDQEAVVVGDQSAWTINVAGGSSGQSMTVRLASGSTLTTFSGATVEEGGVFALEGATLDVQYLDIRGGKLTGDGLVRTGSGPIAGQVEAITGTISPGDGVGQLSIEGRLALGDESVVEIELAGLLAGVEHDQLLVDGPAALSGTLSVTLDGSSYTPTTGDTFELITFDEGAGEFGALDLPTDHQWVVTYEDDAVLLTVSEPGDFNGDGRVDAADYTVWRDGLGTTYDQGDYDTWANNYGAVLSTPSLSTSVPEPTSLLLLAAVALAPIGSRRTSINRI